MEHNILIPLLLTLGAGLATGIGSAIAFFARRTNKRLLSFSLGLSGGVMIYVSFVELFQQAHTTLSDEWGAQTGIIVTVASFFAGILLIGIIDRLADYGNTVVVIEHNLDVIKCADYILDLGPEGGDAGGRIVVTGTPEQVAKNKKSATGQFLKKVLNT